VDNNIFIPPGRPQPGLSPSKPHTSPLTLNSHDISSLTSSSMSTRNEQSLSKPRQSRDRVRGRGTYSMPTPHNLPARIYGRGSYDLSDLGRAFTQNRRAYAPAIGGALGFAAGGIPGAMAGIGAGTAFNKAAGFGAYAVSSNTLYTGDTVPEMHGSGDQVRIKHREYIGDLTSSTLFSLQSYPVNPGQYKTFPWLSTIATAFEQYKFEGLLFLFRSTSADALNSTNTALGTVIMAADYNSASPDFISKIQMEQSQWCVSAKPSESQVAPIECAPQLNTVSTLYVRNGGLPEGTDIRLYDLCKFEVASVGSQAAANIGELWVTYDVVLSKPVLNYGSPSAVYSAHYRTTGAVAASPLGTARTLMYDNMNLTITDTAITIPAYVQGKFSLDFSWIGAAGATAISAVTLTNCTGLPLINGGANFANVSNGAAGSCSMTYYIDVPLSNHPSVITFATGGTYPVAPLGDILIQELNVRVL